MKLPTYGEAQAKAEDGMARAVEHADQDYDWSGHAFMCLQLYVLLNPGPFLIENARAWSHTVQALPLPPDGRAWGGVTARARAAGIIEKVGTGTARSSNNSPKVKWQGC